MANINREDIYLINQHSKLSKQTVEKALQEKVYNDKTAWQKFLKLFFLMLGLGFTTAGIVFFFAYNWAGLHKFSKIGLIEALIITTTILASLSKININIRNIILTGSSVLVGVLFAVFGQIYQTGANAYDFFLAWTIFITLWAAISNFAPLWLLHLVLINTTFVLYTNQVARDWSDVLSFTLLFLINSIASISVVLISVYYQKIKVANWFLNIMVLASATYATIGIVMGIFDQFEPVFLVLIVCVLAVYLLGVLHGLRSKNIFYLAIIPFSLIVIASALLIKISDGELMFLFISLFIIASITGLVKSLINLQKKWIYEK